MGSSERFVSSSFIVELGLFLTSTVSDALVIIRDMASDASQTAANKLRPSEEQLSQIDQPAEENTWHEKPDKEQLKAKFKRNKGVSLSRAPTKPNTAY